MGDPLPPGDTPTTMLAFCMPLLPRGHGPLPPAGPLVWSMGSNQNDLACAQDDDAMAHLRDADDVHPPPGFALGHRVEGEALSLRLTADDPERLVVEDQ